MLLSLLILLVVLPAVLSAPVGVPVGETAANSLQINDVLPQFYRDNYARMYKSCSSQAGKQNVGHCRRVYIAKPLRCDVDSDTATIQHCFFSHQKISPLRQVFFVVPFGQAEDVTKSLKPLEEQLSNYTVFSTALGANPTALFEGQNVTEITFQLSQSSVNNSGEKPFLIIFGLSTNLESLGLGPNDPTQFDIRRFRSSGSIDPSFAVASQPPCSRISKKMPVEWLLDRASLAKSIHVYPNEVDIGTCNYKASNLGAKLDACTLPFLQWFRGYDYVRIRIRINAGNHASNQLLAELHDAFGEPRCSPVATKDFTFINIEKVSTASESLTRIEIVEVSRLVVARCACI